MDWGDFLAQYERYVQGSTSLVLHCNGGGMATRIPLYASWVMDKENH